MELAFRFSQQPDGKIVVDFRRPDEEGAMGGDWEQMTVVTNMDDAADAAAEEVRHHARRQGFHTNQ